MTVQPEDDFREDELAFVFAAPARRFDRKGLFAPKGMSRVDFLVDEPDRVLLVEVKDPGASTVPSERREAWETAGYWNDEIDTRLVPKARGTYVHLHLMEECQKPLTYVVVAGIGAPPEFLLSLTERLQRSIRTEGPFRWKRQYLSSAVVVTVDGFNSLFAPHSVTRTA